MSAARCSRLAKSIHGPCLERLAEWHAADDDELVANMAAQALLAVLVDEAADARKHASPFGCGSRATTKWYSSVTALGSQCSHGCIRVETGMDGASALAT